MDEGLREKQKLSTVRIIFLFFQNLGTEKRRKKDEALFISQDDHSGGRKRRPKRL
jgi:hypothetical protein